jgi:predicted nucleic acid-binding protein
MKVALDTSVLLYLVYPNAPAPIDPATGARVEHCEQRIEGFLEEMDARETQIIIPTPVLSELLIRAHDRQSEILAVLTGKKAVVVQAFDLQAAVENAALRRDKKLTRAFAAQTKNEVRFDLQIMAIAKVCQADFLYTDDGNLVKRCRQAGMAVRGIADIPVPDSKRQIGMPLEPQDEGE